MSHTDYKKVFEAFDHNPETKTQFLNLLNSEVSLPNIPTPTMGGQVFWNTIVEYNGWKLQQNMITHHARILDCNDIRIAWGTYNGMMTALDRMVEGLNMYQAPAPTSNERIDAMNELARLKELLDMGAITTEEYVKKKSKLLDQI